MKSAIARSRRTRVVALASAAGVALALGACSSSSGGSGSGATGGGEKIGVTLITKDSNNPFFVTMQTGAKAFAQKQGNITLTVASGKQEGDDQGQIDAIEASIAKGDKGILITPMSTGVNSAIKKARDAGLYVIALDTPPDPANTVDITFATDNFTAGKEIGEWTAAKLDGKKATIAMLDLFSDQIVSVDTNRDQGFLKGMGIALNNPNKNGDEAPTGKYTGGEGGDYVIAGSQPSNGDQADGRTAMETLLSKNPNINVVYAINEPAAYGAYQALKAKGIEKDTLLVTIDGGCTGVKEVGEGIFGATSQQYPSKMAQLGMEAIVTLAKTGKKPATSAGLDFFNTGSQLVTDKTVPGLKSISSAEGAKICWGK